MFKNRYEITTLDRNLTFFIVFYDKKSSVSHKNRFQTPTFDFFCKFHLILQQKVIVTRLNRCEINVFVFFSLLYLDKIAISSR